MHRLTQHHLVVAAGVARARILGGCAMPAAASWSFTQYVFGVNTDPKPVPRHLLISP